MTQILNARILASVAMLVFVGAIVASSTGAFFSDTETSTGNTFTAGDIDLQIDNTSYVTNNAGVLVASPANTWAISNLTNQLFFSFADVKPGDIGEDTISIHAGTNDAFACMAADITATPENTLVDPEVDATDAGPANGDNGELQNFLNFTFWNDDGDNVYEVGETQITALTGPANTIFQGQWSAVGTGAIPGNGTRYIGKAWCFGTLTSNNTPQDGVNTGTPLTRATTGFTCDGSGANNIAQTDGVVVDVSFQAVQARNNGQFTCASLPTFVGATPAARQTVGAALGAYVAPACTTTVNDGSSIQAAIDANAAGSTICVGPGTHDSDTYPLRVNEDNMSLVSTTGAATTILNGGVILDNDGTKVTGFTIPSSTLLGETFGVYINTGADGVTVSFNDMNGPGVGSGRGVVSAIGVSNALIANNEISNYLTGVFLNPSTNMIVEKNDLVANGVGSANDNPTANIVRNNQITGNSIEGVGVLSVGAQSIAVNSNNIFGNGGAANELNSYDPVDPVNAENNWWGDLTPVDEIGGPGALFVDSTPFEGSAFAQN